MSPSGSRRTDPRVRWLLGLILAVGFLLRLTYLLEVTRAPDFANPQFESQYHDYWARAITTGDWTPPAGVTDPEIPLRPYFRPPGYPWLLAAVYTVAGPGYLAPRVLQMLFGLLSAFLVFALGRRWYGQAAGLFAAALAASYWIFLFFEAEFMEPPLLILLLLLALMTAARWSEAFTPRRAVVAGLLLGLAALVRPNVLVLPPVFLLWAWWLARRRERRGQGFRKPALIFAAAAALAVAPATVRNVLVAGDPVLVTSNAGVNLFVGSHPQGDGYTPGVPELGEIAGLSGWDSFDHPKIAAGVERLAGRTMTDSEVSRFFVRRALRNAAENPAATLALAGRKLLLFWGPAEVSNNKVLRYHRQSSATLLLGPGFATVLALALGGLLLLAWELRGTGGGFSGGREASEVTVLLLLFVAVYSASFLPFFVAARFRVPVVPVLMVFAGAGLAWLWRAAASRAWQRLAVGVLLLLALRAVTGVAWIPYEDDLALWHWRRGLLYEARGDLAPAIAEFSAAVTADPGDGEARLSLAAALAAAGRRGAAIAAYRDLVAREPESLAGRNNLALLLASAGDAAGAVGQWQAALALDPDRVSVLNNLAYALATGDAAVRDVDRAVELGERACRLTDYREPRLLATLAVAYREAGRVEEAEEILRRASDLAGPG